MQEIPKPQTLDPDRPLRHRGTQFTEDDRPESELLSKALHESCEYADQLWDNLNAMRQYLLESLPPGPRVPGLHTTAATSPTGPDDEEGWRNWVDAFAAASSILCGPHGDSGFGLSRAREEAQVRRSAPVLNIHAEDPDRAQHPDADDDTPTPASGPAAADTRDTSSATRAARWTPAKTAAVLAVAAIALRELRPRRTRTPQ